MDKIRASIMLGSKTFDDAECEKCGSGKCCHGGFYSIGNTGWSTPWENSWGKFLLYYLFGNEDESKRAYQLLTEAERKECKTKCLRMAERDEIKTQKKESGFIYIINVGKYFKIGRAKNFVERFKCYVTENPGKPEVVFCKKVANYIEAEKILLKEFSPKRFRGEWFKLSEIDVERAKAII